MPCNYKNKKLTKSPGMADVGEVTKKTLHSKEYAETPGDIVKNIVGKKK